MNPTVCFVIPYFGQWPFWFSFFLRSCQTNHDISWILYSDCPIPDELPSNVRIITTSYSDYCDRVSDTLKINFRPLSPYKLCDLKPALGYVHEEELKGFDFWAFGDIDLVYGNLRSHFTSDRLARYEIIVTHERRVSGHCCLLRNSSFMQTAFMQVANWKELLSNPRHQWFDESAFSHLFIRHKNWPRTLSKITRPFSRWARSIDNVEAFTTPYGKIPWVDGSRDYPQQWFWNEGRLTNDRDGGREFPYFHFVVWKKFFWKNNAAVEESATAELASGGRWSLSVDGFSPLT